MSHKPATAIIPFFIVLITVLIMTNSSYAAKMYKWVDADGNISYQGQPPPKNTKVLTEKTFENRSTSTSLNNRNKKPVIVYITDSCAMCELVISHLIQSNVPYQTKSMNDRAVQKTILERIDRLLVPTVEINDALFTDNSKAALENNLINAGYKLTDASNTQTNSENSFLPESSIPSAE